jgi:hypothetical protein
MPGFRGLLVLAVAMPLGGCFSVTAPKELPSWAMSSVEQGEPARRKVARRTSPQRVARDDDSDEVPTVTGNAAMPTNGDRPAVRTVTRPAASAGPTAFTPEWHARENAADEALRRRMNICRGC